MGHETEHKSFGAPEETREFPNDKAEIVSIGGAEVGRMTFQPGWRWSNDVKPIAGTVSCEAPHFPVPRQRPARDPYGRRHGADRPARRCDFTSERARRVGRR
jgi:hypothetical protein